MVLFHPYFYANSNCWHVLRAGEILITLIISFKPRNRHATGLPVKLEVRPATSRERKQQGLQALLKVLQNVLKNAVFCT